MGALVSNPPGSAAATELHVAAGGANGTRSVRWASLRVQGTATAFAWIVPVRDGAYLDLASDAWLESLESASAPRVVPPDPTPPCGISGTAEIDGDPGHRATTAPDAVVVAQDRSGLDAALAQRDLALTSDLAPGIDAAAAAGARFAVLFYGSGAADVRTRALRVVDGAGADVAASLLRGAPGGTTVVAYAIESGAARVGYVAPLVLDPSFDLWGSDGTSTYASATHALLLGTPGAFYVDTIAHDIVFGSVPVPGGAPVPALDRTYFFRAASYGDAPDAPGPCANAAEAAGAALSPVAPACPAGAAARVNVTSACSETSGAGEIDPSTFRCGGASDDLALALSGLAPAQAWVTRARAWIAPDADGPEAPVGIDENAASRGPVIQASGYETACPAPGSGSGGAGGSAHGSSPSPGSGNGSGSASASDLGNAAGGAAAGAAGGCGGDSSSDGSSSGCGGDTSSTSDGTDSSSSSSCGGDTSSSSSDSSGSCGGDTSSSSSSDCSTAGRTTSRSRTPASRALILLAALAAVVRRARRKPDGDRGPLSGKASRSTSSSPRGAQPAPPPR